MTQTEQDQALHVAQTIEPALEKANLRLVQNISQFNSNWHVDADESAGDILGTSDHPKDPAIVLSDVAAQTSYLRKLKFQYLEQNAKDKYVKTIVSDIDDAPIVTAEDNKALLAANEVKKERLKVAKTTLAEKQYDIRTLAPLVEEDYNKAHRLSGRATELAEKIIDARLALTRLRQTHPQPRLTVSSADDKLAEQVAEMQSLNDDLQNISMRISSVKEQLKSGSSEIEHKRAEKAEMEKAARLRSVEEDDARLVPLYDWYTASLALHRCIHSLRSCEQVSDNELKLTYGIPSPRKAREHGRACRHIVIALIFKPGSRQLAAAQISGPEGIDFEDIVGSHVQSNDVHGLVAAILARARSNTKAG